MACHSKVFVVTAQMPSYVSCDVHVVPHRGNPLLGFLLPTECFALCVSGHIPKTINHPSLSRPRKELALE